MSAYPEHEKLHKIKDLSQSIHDFLEWAGAERNIMLGYSAKFSETRWKSVFGDETEEVMVERFAPFPGSLQILLSDFFGIDLEVLEREKRHMLSELQAANAG